MRNTHMLAGSLTLAGLAAAGLWLTGCGNNGGINPFLGGQQQQISLVEANTTLARVATTTLPGGDLSPVTVANANFAVGAAPTGTSTAPALSNNIVSAVPGNPPKPIYVGQPGTFDTVIISIPGLDGFFAISAAGATVVGGETVLGLDPITPSIITGTFQLNIATQLNGVTSAPTVLTLVIDPHVFVSAGDLRNDNSGTSGSSNTADLFGAQLEGSTSTTPQNITNFDNNTVVNTVGNVTIKGAVGPVTVSQDGFSGHREVVWDGVPDKFRDNTNFPPVFFNRFGNQTFGVQGGVTFTAINSTDGNATSNQEVNDVFNKVPQGANFTATTIGGDFTNVNALLNPGDLLAFTQNADFATLGTVVCDLTFSIAGVGTPAIVHGLGVDFSSVDKPNITSIQYFDANNNVIATVFPPTVDPGPFPFAFPNPNPGNITISSTRFPYSFAGFHDNTKQIARVRLTVGEVPVDSGEKDVSAGGTHDIAAFDDTYWSEPVSPTP